MTLTCDGQRFVLLQRQITWVEPTRSQALSPTLYFFAFVRNYNHRYVTHARERECRGEPVPQDTQSLAGVVGDSRERDSGVSMYVCGLRVERIVRIGAIGGRSRWPVARVRLHEHEQPDCRRESPRIRWLLMSFWCHSLLSSSLFRARKYIRMLIVLSTDLVTYF